MRLLAVLFLRWLVKQIKKPTHLTLLGQLIEALHKCFVRLILLLLCYLALLLYSSEG